MFIVPNFHKLWSTLSKTDIFCQTNEFENTIGPKYHFSKLLLRDALFGKKSIDTNFDLYLVEKNYSKNGHGRSKNIQVYRFRMIQV